MSAFIIYTAKIKDPAKIQEYGAKVAPTMEQFGAEVLVRGKFASALVGDTAHDMAGLVRFPDMNAVMSWAASDAYAALQDIRDAAGTVTITAYQVPPA